MPNSQSYNYDIIQLRPYQIGAIENLKQAIANGKKRVLLQAATGAGKTIIASEIIRRATDKQKRVLFIAHRKEIIKQTSDKLNTFSIDHGVIMANFGQVNNHPVQVASIQTLTRRDKPPADLVILDECHLSISDSFKKIIEHYSDATIIGLTATPIRLDGRGLGEIYQDIIQVVPMAQLISEGHLVKPRVFAPFTPDMKNVRKSKGDYDASETASLMDKKQITADIVKHWIDAARLQGIDFIQLSQSRSENNPKDFRKTIIFASSVQHSKNLVEEFQSTGISAKHLDATTPAKQRDATLQAWRDNEFTVLSNCGLFIEGLDVPDASCVILARPTKSLTIYLQAVGRVMRPAENKTDCIILDCAGLTYEHGLVDMPRHWTLDGKMKREKSDVKPVHLCPECFAAYSKAESPNECPECGYCEPKPERAVKHIETELKELTGDLLTDLEKRLQFKSEIKLCKTLDDFKAMACRRGYKAGWAFIKYNDRVKWLQSKGYPVPSEAA